MCRRPSKRPHFKVVLKIKRRDETNFTFHWLSSRTFHTSKGGSGCLYIIIFFFSCLWWAQGAITRLTEAEQRKNLFSGVKFPLMPQTRDGERPWKAVLPRQNWIASISATVGGAAVCRKGLIASGWRFKSPADLPPWGGLRRRASVEERLLKSRRSRKWRWWCFCSAASRWAPWQPLC